MPRDPQTSLNSAQNPIKNSDFRLLPLEKLTPMMQHYVSVKGEYPQALLLYRVGDFYETFFQDACTIAEILELVLTTKDGGKEIGRVPMAGVPHHAIDRYAAQLVEKGYAVAICDQTEDAAQAQGLVRREVTRVLTPGTMIEDNLLTARQNNYLAAIFCERQAWGLAYADISTGEFWVTQAEGPEILVQELWRLQASEVLFPVSTPDLAGLLRPGEVRSGLSLPAWLPNQFCYALRPASCFAYPEARQTLLDRFGLRSLEGIGCDRLPLAVRAAGALLGYVAETVRGRADQPRTVPLQLLRTYQLSDYLILDHQTRRNLELVQTVRDGTLSGSLLWALDQTVTAMGGRALRRWLLQPLLTVEAIETRQETIAELIDRPDLRQDLQRLLREMYDLERLAGRAGSGTATARDLVALGESLSRLPDLAALAEAGQSAYLRALQMVPPVLEQLGDHLRAMLVESPPLSVLEGGLIREGVHERLDQMRHQSAGDREWLANLEASERQRTGLHQLKVGYNKAFGYYISLSRSKADLAPTNYIRKQTLVNEERYITPELKEREARMLSAREELNQLEYEIFCELRRSTGIEAETIRKQARAVAAIDVLVNFANLAIARGYCRPQVLAEPSRLLDIRGGRHPVVEQSLPAGLFVPNATGLGSRPSPAQPDSPSPLTTAQSNPSQAHQPPNHTEKNTAEIYPDLIILTGPNASGKSCYLRQVGLIQLMAQVGCYVPAESARLSLCDRIFTRVGAVDDLATGQSTFMVEMNETANILNHATDRSLVLLDEIGRGTATFDGLSIAWSVAEYLAQTIRSRTIFATHYHELNELAGLVANVANFQVAVKELPDRIVFLHQVQPGGADRSYGIEAGRLAGLPASVIQRARTIMGQIEKHSKIAIGLRKTGNKPTPANPAPEANSGDRNSPAKQNPSDQLGLFR